MSAKISTEDLMKGNKLIAEFMGETIRSDGRLALTNPEPLTSRFIVDAKYHSSWDWLMPVCKKLESLPEHENFNKKNYAKWVENSECLGDALWKCDINHVWQAVTQFITWYNQQK